MLKKCETLEIKRILVTSNQILPLDNVHKLTAQCTMCDSDIKYTLIDKLPLITKCFNNYKLEVQRGTTSIHVHNRWYEITICDTIKGNESHVEDFKF